MRNSLAAIPGSRAGASSPQEVSTKGFDPGRRALEEMVDELLDPLRGIERGLLDEDEDTLLINIRVRELRKVGRCLRLAAKHLLSETHNG